MRRIRVREGHGRDAPATGARSARGAAQHVHHAPPPRGVARGSASDIENEGKELLKIRAKINKMVSRATGQTEEKVNDDIRRDFHLTAEQALDYGVIDKVLYKRRGPR